MDVHLFLDTIHLAEGLKDTLRHCYTSKGRRESVAEHSWRLVLMAYFLKDEFPEADINKVMLMCTIHDLGELFIGDIPSFNKTEEDEKREEELLNDWVLSLPQPYCDELSSLYQEMKERNTLEAKIYKALDGLEAVIQHNESSLSTWEDHEYELNRNYAYNRVQFSSYMQELRDAIREETEKKIEEGNK
ncbi:MAG: HD domain-containing protein [Solobacterium sp.]|nr:HD domain-containing protein [Solobacterium sp.]